MKKIFFLFIATIIAITVAGFITASQGRFGIFTALTILFPFVILAFIFSLITKNSRNKEKLLKTGEPAKAKILSISETSVMINHKPRIALQLEVTPQTGQPFNVAIHALISPLQPLLYRPGMILNVRYDPNDLKSIAIESFDKNEVQNNGHVNIYIKPLLCPSCGGQITVDRSQIKEKFINCSYCGTLIDLHD